MNLKEQQWCVTELLTLVFTKPEDKSGSSILLKSLVGTECKLYIHVEDMPTALQKLHACSHPLWANLQVPDSPLFGTCGWENAEKHWCHRTITAQKVWDVNSQLSSISIWPTQPYQLAFLGLSFLICKVETIFPNSQGFLCFNEIIYGKCLALNNSVIHFLICLIWRG